jgi:hypothetical protein
LPRWLARYRAVQRGKTGTLLAVGRDANLSAYRTRDRGKLWTPIAAQHPDVQRFAERCLGEGGQRAFRFGISEDEAHTTLEYTAPDAAAHVVEFSPAAHEIFAAACDDAGLVAALRPPRSSAVRLVACPFRRACQPMTLAAGTWPAGLRFPLDVARLSGTTIVAWERGGVVRVTSSRDEGRTWTPVSVAFDAAEFPRASGGFAPPDRMLAVDGRVLLYAGAERSDADYLLLVSDDLGASFRTPYRSCVARARTVRVA